MGDYLQQYGIEEEHRNRIIKRIVLAVVAAIIVLIAGYLIFHNYPERRVVNSFVAKINAHDYKGAYAEWGCTDRHPCPNYDFQRFLDDWGPSKKTSSPWKVVSTDSCKSFLTANVQAQGSELESLSVQREDHSLGFAPAPECQERKWRWRQFFQRVFGGGTSKSGA